MEGRRAKPFLKYAAEMRRVLKTALESDLVNALLVVNNSNCA